MRAEVEYDVKSFENRHSEDAKVYVRFYIETMEDEAASQAAKRPIFREREFIEIRAPGNSTNIVKRPVTKMDIDRFPKHYDLFKRGVNEPVVGTPLSEMLWIRRSMAEELKYVKILTVEQLSEVSDDVCGRIPGLYDLKAKARKYLEDASKPNVDELLARIAALEAQAKGSEEEPEEE